jgi:hypothetical protein
MDRLNYAEMPDEYFDAYFGAYRDLCGRTRTTWLSLFFGAIGQGMAYQGIFEPLVGRASIAAVMTLTYGPFLVYMFLTFFRLPPRVTPRTFRRIMLGIASWNVASSLVILALAPIWVRSHAGGRVGTVMVWAFIALGYPAVLRLIRHHRLLRRQEQSFRCRVSL